ncbi:MAG: FMN-binding protein [Pseudomonadales bacterium]|nr:FMN-binding protein [Pseudomonadales bacterium]
MCSLSLYSSIRFLSILFYLCLTVIGSTTYAQDEWENLEPAWLEEVMPLADSFSSKQGNPPVYHAYQSSTAGGEPELIGYVFASPDLPPEEVGFSGPIDLLIGLNLSGAITGVKVLHYLESYLNIRGDFIGDANFAAQFLNKPIGDEFRVGRDIDGMTRATITSWAVARSVRNSTRRVAEAYMPGHSYSVAANFENQALETLRNQNWDDYLASGFVKEFLAPIVGETDLRFSVAYMGHYRLGELLVGASDYSNSDRTASEMIEDGHMLLLGLNGNTPRLQQLRLGAIQNGQIYPNRGDRVVFAGSADEGKIAGRARFAIAMFMHPDIDITQPFTVIYDISETRGQFNDYVGVDYQLTEDVLTLTMGNSINTENPVIQNALTVVILILALVLFVLNLPRIRASISKSGD